MRNTGIWRGVMCLGLAIGLVMACPGAVFAGRSEGPQSPFIVYDAKQSSVRDSEAAVQGMLRALRTISGVQAGEPDPRVGQSYFVDFSGPARRLGMTQGPAWIFCRVLVSVVGADNRSQRLIALRMTALSCRQDALLGGGRPPSYDKCLGSNEMERLDVVRVLARITEVIRVQTRATVSGEPPGSLRVSWTDNALERESHGT